MLLETKLFIDDPAQVDRLVAALRERLRAMTVAGLPPGRGVTVSAGCALRRPAEAPDALLRRTDAALYAAKRAGRDGLKFAD